MNKNTGEGRFFLLMAWTLFGLAVGGFGLHALVRPERLPPISPVVLFHGTTLFAWYGLIWVALGVNEMLTLPVLLALLGAVILHDWRTRGRPHAATWVGSGVIIGGLPVGIVLGQSSGWRSLLQSAFGRGNHNGWTV